MLGRNFQGIVDLVLKIPGGRRVNFETVPMQSTNILVRSGLVRLCLSVVHVTEGK